MALALRAARLNAAPCRSVDKTAGSGFGRLKAARRGRPRDGAHQPNVGSHPILTSLITAKTRTRRAFFDLERVMGIEPTSSAWEAEVLPLNYTRSRCEFYSSFAWPEFR